MLAYLGCLGSEPHHGRVNLKLGLAIQPLAQRDILTWFGVEPSI